MAAIVGFTHLLAGFDNPALVRRHHLLGRPRRVLFTKVYGRVLAPGLAELDPPPNRSRQPQRRRTPGRLDRRLNQFTNAALTAA